MALTRNHVVLILLLAAAAVFSVCWAFAVRKRLGLKLPALVGLALLNVALNLLFVRLFASLEKGKWGVNQGRRIYGSMLFMPLVLFAEAKLTKQEPAEFTDCFTLLQIIHLALGRVYCFHTGCCYGKLIPGTALRWPTRELELFFYAAVFVWFALRRRRGKTPGLCCPLFLISYGLFRFGLEFLRYEPMPRSFRLALLWSLIAVVAGVCLLSEVLHRRAEKPPKGERSARSPRGARGTKR